MPHSAEQYKGLFKHLLPRGKAWTRDIDSWLDQLLYGLGEELSRVEGRIENLVSEVYTPSITELLEEYEADFGLPELYRSLASTIEGRRKDIHTKMLAVGGQYESYYISLALSLGYTVFFEFFLPAISGVLPSGSSCGMSSNIFYWLIHVDPGGDKGAFDWSFHHEEFDAADPQSYDYIQSMKRIYSNLKYELSRLRPAHIMPLFDWGNKAFSRGFSWAFDCFPFYDGTIPPGPFGYEFDTSFLNNWNYDGEYLVGSFNNSFRLDFDGCFGSDFYKREFDESFARPQ